MRDAYQLAPPIAFFHLAIDQAWFHLPLAHVAPSTAEDMPLTKVGRERIEVHIQAITGEEWETAGSQELSESVDELMCHVLCSGDELKHRKKLRARINS